MLGLDLCDKFSGPGGMTWGKLVRMTDQLPPHSQFKAAMMDDDEYIASLGLNLNDDDDGSKKKQTVPLTHYDPMVERLTDVCDLLIGLRTTLIAVNSDKGKAPKDVKFMARPETAFDRLRRRERTNKLNELRSILLPDE